MADFILPHALPTALDGRDGIKMLSLDCFDTLLWRDTHAPKDLFGALSGTTVTQRQWAEERARMAADLREQRGEVTIEEIYGELLPNDGTDTRALNIQNELDAEAAHCFAFRPTVELMRAAKRRGLQIIIVSDTYLNPDQLRGLIAAAAGKDIADMIDRVFCSATYGKAKSQGLYEFVLKAVSVKPHEILHIGDNKNADVGGVAPFGVHTLHLQQFAESTEQRLRLEAAVGTMLHPMANEVALTYQPHRAALSMEEPAIGDPVEAFGFATLGPVLHGFDRWLAEEAEALQAKHGGKVHHVFLMRDGYLPQLMYQASSGHAGHALEISRFTSAAASFSDAEAVRRYVEGEAETDPAVVAKQLLLPAHDIKSIIAKLPRTDLATRQAAFSRAIGTPSRTRQIVKASTAFAERLVAHVRRIVDPAPGDRRSFDRVDFPANRNLLAEARLSHLDGIVLPGGESTTMYKLARTFEVFEPLQQAIRAGLPAYGTCAGMIMLADQIENGIAEQDMVSMAGGLALAALAMSTAHAGVLPLPSEEDFRALDRQLRGHTVVPSIGNTHALSGSSGCSTSGKVRRSPQGFASRSSRASSRSPTACSCRWRSPTSS